MSGLTIDTTGFTPEENRLALEVLTLEGEARAAYYTLQEWRRIRDCAALMVGEARAYEKRIGGRAYRALYRLEKMIGYEEGHHRGRRILAKDDRCVRLDDKERGRFAQRSKP